MNNKNGFTLTEILLAVMIVGVIGIALAALTTAAVRESGVGRTRMMLRNQISIALRQLRQDIHESTAVTGVGESLTLAQDEDKKIGPKDDEPEDITYRYENGRIRRYQGGLVTVWLENVRVEEVNGFSSPKFFLDNGGKGVNSVLRVNLIVGINAGNIVVEEAVDETFMLPHGFAIKND